MIYLLSDLHAELDFAAFDTYLQEDHTGDLLVILGDIGLKLEKTEENERFTQRFLAAPCPIALVDGNHENFDYLYSFPVEDWQGGKVHRLTPNIVHLMRGYIFQLEGSSFFVFGGCKSSPKWKSQGKWFPQEVPGPEEYAQAYASLEDSGNRVDYILTHKYYDDPEDPHLVPEQYRLNQYIDNCVDFKQWYSGHIHKNCVFDERHRMIYDIPVRVE